MNVGFYHVGRGDEREARARIGLMVASVRRGIPSALITQFTDLTTARIKGIDDIVRRNVLPIALGCVDAYASVTGEWLFLDTDVVVQSDVRGVFYQLLEGPPRGRVMPAYFDIALADRRGTLREADTGKSIRQMPFNKGVVFSKSQAFWIAVQQRLAELSEKRQGWMGDQQAMCDTIASGLFNVRVLPSTYNYPPHRHDEDVRDKHILHFKGKERKAWMCDYALKAAA